MVWYDMGIVCAIWYVRDIVLYAKDGWLGVYDIATGRGRHLSWEESVEIRGDKYRSLSQITLPGSSVFRDPGAAEQVGLKFCWRRTRV